MAAVLALSVGIFDASGIRRLDGEYEECSTQGLATQDAGGDLTWSSDLVYRFLGCRSPDVLTGVQRIRANGPILQLAGPIERVEIGGITEGSGFFKITPPSGSGQGEKLLRGWTFDQLLRLGGTAHNFEYESFFAAPGSAADFSSVGARGSGVLRYQSTGFGVIASGRTQTDFFNRGPASCLRDGDITATISRLVQFTTGGDIVGGEVTLASLSSHYPNLSTVSFDGGVTTVTVGSAVVHFFTQDVIDSANTACDGFFHRLD